MIRSKDQDPKAFFWIYPERDSACPKFICLLVRDAGGKTPAFEDMPKKPKWTAEQKAAAKAEKLAALEAAKPTVSESVESPSQPC